MQNFVLLFLDLANETLAAAIVIIAVSLLLYNISRNFYDRVARTSGIVLACVTVAYVADVLISLEPSMRVHEALLRLQYLGIALIPAALFHLSDALLDTTGLPSRGRRRRVIRIMYAISLVFLISALFSDSMVRTVIVQGQVRLHANALFIPFLAFTLVGCIGAFINVNRARRRCLTRSTKKRMAYLEAVILMPAVAIFPYSALITSLQEVTLVELAMVNAANVLVILMLLFLSYPLSFFGSRVPDRVVKAELLRFVLRGPMTALLVLGTIIYIRPASQIFSLPGDDFMPFATVTMVLFWQWMVHLALPWLEKRLIYGDESEERLLLIERLNSQLLTRDDLMQLIEATLESACDNLRVNRAFVVSALDGQPDVTRAVGLSSDEVSAENAVALLEMSRASSGEKFIVWENYSILPLYSHRVSSGSNGDLTSLPVIGVMGIEQRPENPLEDDDHKQLGSYAKRVAHTLDDLHLQNEIYAALEGLLPQITTSRGSTSDVEYKPGYVKTGTPPPTEQLERDHVIEQVGAALRHYYGGPGMSKSRLLDLQIVIDAMTRSDNNPVKALRAVLDEAIERQRPAGERDYRSQEWLLYNILDLRFLKKKMVRDTARTLYMSDANLYRKQNLAIEAVADTLLQMESEYYARTQTPPAARESQPEQTKIGQTP